MHPEGQMEGWKRKLQIIRCLCRATQVTIRDNYYVNFTVFVRFAAVLGCGCASFGPRGESKGKIAYNKVPPSPANPQWIFTKKYGPFPPSPACISTRTPNAR